MLCLQIGPICPELDVWERRNVPIRDEDNSLVVKLWAEKARGVN